MKFANLILVLGFSLPAGQNAAPSSHMVFDDNFPGDILINEVRVPKAGEAMYTYYETLGWRGRAAGYAGIQAHPKAHNYIFPSGITKVTPRRSAPCITGQGR